VELQDNNESYVQLFTLNLVPPIRPTLKRASTARLENALLKKNALNEDFNTYHRQSSSRSKVKNDPSQIPVEETKIAPSPQNKEDLKPPSFKLTTPPITSRIGTIAITSEVIIQLIR
jgi:hypothetical protein